MIRPTTFFSKENQRYARFNFKSLAVFTSFVLISCAQAPLSHQERIQQTKSLAEKSNWEKIEVNSSPFSLVSYAPKNQGHTKLLSIYIEGDGLVVLPTSKISSNPTPINPTALKLALTQPGGNVAYLARPCQQIPFDASSLCKQGYWTNLRFSQDVINSIQGAVDMLKKKYGAENIQLIGFSGGGAVATLIAAQRKDVRSLITVAGNLDHKTWTKTHRLPELQGSLNPIDFSQALGNIPQVHFAGGKDRTIGLEISQAFVSSLPDNHSSQLRIIKDYTHSCCWAENWRKLYSEASNSIKLQITQKLDN